MFHCRRPQFLRDRFAALAVVAALTGCAGSTRPASFPEQMAFESRDLPVEEIRSPDGSFSTRITGRLESDLAVMDDASVSAVIDIGSTAPVECTFFRGDLDLASAMIEFSDRGFEEVAKHLGHVLEKQTQQITAGAIAGSPTLSLAWRYRVGEGIGLIKHRIASVDGHGLYCRHVETGYAKTFARLFATMVRNLERTDESVSEAVYTVVSRTRLRGQPRGVEKHVAQVIGDGSIRMESRSSMLVASHYGRLSAIDTVFVRFARPDGGLINAVYARSEDGTLVTNLSLDPRNDVWVLSGTRNGVSYEQEIQGRTSPMSILAEVRALRETLLDHGAADRTVEIRGWYPHFDPLKLMKRTTVVGARQDVDHFQAISKVGPVVVESVIDSTGETTWSRWLDPSIGELETELVFADGEI